MKFSIYKLDGNFVEFHAYWYHNQFGPSSTGDCVIHNLLLPITGRIAKRAIGNTMCTLTPTVDGKVSPSSNAPFAQGDAACSASELGGYSKQRGRIASFGSALRVAGFNRVERAALWQQYWEQQGRDGPSLQRRKS